VNVVGELQQKRTLAASCGFLAAARLSCCALLFVYGYVHTCLFFVFFCSFFYLLAALYSMGGLLLSIVDLRVFCRVFESNISSSSFSLGLCLVWFSLH